MKTRKLLTASLALSVLTGTGFAQTWSFTCIDPDNTAPYSDDYLVTGTGNSLIQFAIGISGTVTYGGTAGPCYNPAITLNAEGRFAISTGSVGSVQTTFDNDMPLTFGAPNDPVGDYCYSVIYVDGAGALFGNGGLSVVFNGLSKRYVKAVWRDGNVEADLVVRVIGDAVRYDWKLRNLQADQHDIGMRYCVYPAMRTMNGPDLTGHTQSGSRRQGRGSNARPNNIPGSPYISWVETPTVKPLRSEKSWLRNNLRFPDWVRFQWSQAQPYGMRIDNVPDTSIPDATPTDHFLVGNHQIQLVGNTPRGRVFTDPGQGDPGIDVDIDPVIEDSDTGLNETSFIQTWSPTAVPANQIRNIVHYVRSPWSIGDYLDPYTVLVDAPRLVESRPGLGLNDLSPNPMTIAAYVDNQYADLDREVTMQDVRIRINITPGSGLRLAAGETEEKLLAQIDPNQIRSVSWQVEADGTQVGNLPYSITFTPNPGPAKTVSGSVLVSAAPRLRLAEGPNLLTVPWTFTDTSFDAILGPTLKYGRDYLAYRWDAGLNSYQPATSAIRGNSYWIVPISDFGYQPLSGANMPSDQNAGGLVTTLNPGWNMIGNPYSVPIPLSQLTAVGEADPSRSYTWSELVNNGWVTSSLAYWERSVQDPTDGTYKFTLGDTDLLLPQVGYWVYVTTFQPIRLQWPPLFTTGISQDVRSSQPVWTQSDRQWRLQLMARTQSGMDSENYVGIASSTQNANRYRIFEPPMAPGSEIELSVNSTVNGRPTRLAQALSDRQGKQSWNVSVHATKPGEVTVSWPNLSSVPRNVRLKLIDPTNNTTKDLRFQSSYSFRMTEAGTRELTIEAEPSGASRAVIGSVTVARPSRAPGAPVSINYTLSTDAITTVRILSSSGKEIFTVSRGRAAGAGENAATWNLRDNANRAVAPGTYQVEILAETSNGDRARKLVPVNIVR